MSDDMSAAYRRMFNLSTEVRMTERQGWTRQQWIDDARKIMNHLDGSVSSLLNGHVLAMLDELKSKEQQ